MTQSFIFVTPDGFDLQNITSKNVRTAFILRLPFRVRVGAMRRLRMDSSIEVVFRNTYPIPTAPTREEIHKLTWVGDKPRPREELLTDAMILDLKPEVTDEQAVALAQWLKDAQQRPTPGYRLRYFVTHEALNDAIVAYHTATKHLVNGYTVERLTDTEYMFGLRYAHTILCPADYEMTDDDLRQLFDAKAEREFRTVGGQFTLNLADAPEQDLAKLDRSLELHREYIFFQFALDAKSHMAQRDFMAGLLYSIVALEGAHAVLLKLCLRKSAADLFPDDRQCDKYVEEKANKLLMDVGFSAMVELTSLLLLESADRPSLEEITACQQGITIRNEIMHALAKRGKYRFRNRKNDEITKAYSAVIQVYDHFVGLIEKYPVPAEAPDEPAGEQSPPPSAL